MRMFLEPVASTTFCTSALITEDVPERDLLIGSLRCVVDTMQFLQSAAGYDSSVKTEHNNQKLSQMRNGF